MYQNFQPYNLDCFGVRLPEISIPQEDKIELGLDEKATNLDYLVKLCNKGFENKILNKKIDPKKSKEYADRCKLELATFKKLNLVDYVLLVHDVLMKLISKSRNCRHNSNNIFEYVITTVGTIIYSCVFPQQFRVIPNSSIARCFKIGAT